MGRSPQQLATHELLEPADLPAQRRLRHVQPFRGAAEVELLRNRNERSQMAQLDAVGGLWEGQQVSVFGHPGKYGPPALRR